MHTKSTKSTARNALATIALFAFASFGSACDWNYMAQPGRSAGGMQLTSPAQVIPCDPPTASGPSDRK